MATRNILLLSSSQVHGYGYLEHSKKVIVDYLTRNNVKEVTFIPYANAHKDYDGYAKRVHDAITPWGFSAKGLHSQSNPVEAINSAQCIFIGGGNTFQLLKTLYDLALIEPIRKRVLNDSVPYIGSSAGTNVATVSIKTTNDMPIVLPPSFAALNLVPFNINPHYLDPEANSTHKGETREMRINEFHALNDTPVLGLREGTCLLVEGAKATLLGTFNARLFQKSKDTLELEPGSDLSFLLQN